MNSNKALWEKGDFTRVADTMRASGEALAARLGVTPGNRRAAEAGLANCRFQEGDASDLHGLGDRAFDLVVSLFGAMFAPRPVDVAREMVVTRPGGRIVMGNWIPGD